MCGHCTERAALAERLALMSTRGTVDADPLLLAVRMQEAVDWRGALRGMSASDDLVVAIIALCRVLSERTAGGASGALNEALPSPLLARLTGWLGSLDLPETWHWLRDVDGMPSVPLQATAAREELDAYFAGWLQAQVGSAPAWSDAMLHERLPRVSVALDLLCRDAPDDDRLVTLALASPGATSPFSAIDLWLQRRATRTVVAHHGIAFVLPLLDRWRSGALLAAVLHGDLDRAALHGLRAALAQRGDNGTEGMRDLRIAIDRTLAIRRGHQRAKASAPSDLHAAWLDPPAT